MTYMRMFVVVTHFAIAIDVHVFTVVNFDVPVRLMSLLLQKFY